MNRLSIAFIFACTIAVAWSDAGEIDSGRIAIIDASINTKPYLDAFAKAGIKVIGRYYSRCPQPEIVPEKRLACVRHHAVAENVRVPACHLVAELL